ncbi:MAG: hypothetical protein AB7T63_05430 [Planctomycetota bacterium]
MTAPPPTAGRPFRLWWLAALLAAIWAGLALAHVIPRDGPPPGTKGVPLAQRVAQDLVRENPDRLAGWRPFDGLESGGGARSAAPQPAERTWARGLVQAKPREVQSALEALLVAWLFDVEEGRRSWAARGPEPLDPDLVAAVEKALQLR